MASVPEDSEMIRNAPLISKVVDEMETIKKASEDLIHPPPDKMPLLKHHHSIMQSEFLKTIAKRLHQQTEDFKDQVTMVRNRWLSV